MPRSSGAQWRRPRRKHGSSTKALPSSGVRLSNARKHASRWWRSRWFVLHSTFPLVVERPTWLAPWCRLHAQSTVRLCCACVLPWTLYAQAAALLTTHKDMEAQRAEEKAATDERRRIQEVEAEQLAAKQVGCRWRLGWPTAEEFLPN